MFADSGPGIPEGLEQRSHVSERGVCRNGLAHPAEGVARAFGLQRHRDNPDAGLEPDLVEVASQPQDRRGAQHRMARKRQFLRRGENAEAGVRPVLRRVDEHRLREVHFSREPTERGIGNVGGVREHREWVPGERGIGEDIADGVGPRAHGDHHITHLTHRGRAPANGSSARQVPGTPESKHRGATSCPRRS